MFILSPNKHINSHCVLHEDLFLLNGVLYRFVFNNSHKVYAFECDTNVNCMSFLFFNLKVSADNIAYFDMIGLLHHHITSDLTDSIVKNMYIT